MFLKTAAIALLMGSAAYGQSLADAARQNREQQDGQDSSATAKPRVITNADLPKGPDAKPAPSETAPGASAAASSKAADRRLAEQRYAQQRLTEQHAAEQWKRQILVQKYKMEVLQARIDQINASIRSRYGTVQYEWYQAQQVQRVAQIQRQLDEQQKKLDQMQEAARHAGMHTAVYDP
jgi:ATP-dependent Lon protease